jgi:predicted nucleotidyltransferase
LLLSLNILCCNELGEADMSQEKLEQLLRELKSGLAMLYGSRLSDVYLFGSYARGEQDAESDLDIMERLGSITLRLVCRRVHEDTATLLRCLVDEQLLARRESVYWRV